jgi:cell division septal protein FtsQ
VFKSKAPAKRRKVLMVTANGRAALMPAVFDAAMSARVLSVAILFGVLLAAFELAMGEAFYIYNPSVTGNQRVPAADILAASGIETLHVLWLEPERAARALTAKLPEVRAAFIWCSLPAECTIQVREREPMFEWKQNQTRTWVDAEGYAFPARGPTPPIPVIEIAPDVPALVPGRPVQAELIGAVQELVRILPEVKSLRYSPARGIEFTDPQGNWPVIVGVGPDMAGRVNMWKAVSANLVSRKVQPKFIDVRYPQAPYYGK